jgi:hypothetical protein
MKTPLLIALAVVLGIVATNILIPKKTDLAHDTQIEDSIGTSQAAPKQVDGDMPL